jgi:phage terminase small subunit
MAGKPGRSGRKRKPTILHVLQGTYNATDHADRINEPVAVGNLTAETPAPEWMTPSQQAGWRYAIEHAPLGVLKKIDASALVTWVLAEDRQRIAAVAQARLDVGNELPLLVRGRGRQFIPSPYVAILSRTGIVLIRAAAELGFTPASRPRMTSGEHSPWEAEDDNDPWRHLRLIPGGRKDDAPDRA